MKDKAMFEELESRRLLSVSISATRIGVTSGSAAAAAATASIEVAPNTLYFNAVTQANTSTANSVDGNSSGGPHTSTYVLRVTNTGSRRILLSSIKIRGTNQTAFKVLDFPAGGASMGAGKLNLYTVQFTADSTVGIKSAFVAVTSSLGVNRIPLRGLVTAGEGTTFEPSLQTLFDFFQLPINAGETVRNDPYFKPSGTSDEVDISTLVKAVPTLPIIVRPLAEFTNHATPDVRMGFYTPGVLNSEKYAWYSPTQSSQSVAPLAYGQTKFSPGTSPFGLVTQYPYFTNPDGTTTNVYSENTLNKQMYTSGTNSSLVHMKFYPYKNQNGTVVKNAYIVAEEEYGVDSVSDSQDMVFVVTNVKPAPAKPTVAIQNLTGFPSNDIATFNTLTNPDPFVGNILKTSNTIRVLNSGTQPLVASFGLTGTNASDFSITSGGGSGVTIAPGAYRDVTVHFSASSGTSVHSAALVVTSNDSATPSTSVGLLGNWQQYSEQMGQGSPSLEPSAQKLVDDLLGYQSVLPSSFDSIGSTLQYPGDEVNAEYFQTADTNAPVNVTQLATFHNVTYVNSSNQNIATSSFIGWYKQGSPGTATTILNDNADQGQMVLGPGTSGNGSVAHGKVKATGSQVFGFVVEHSNTDSTKPGEYSDHTLNVIPSGQQHPELFGGLFLRFFAAYDEHGVRIPNAYIMLHDYNKTTTNYDYQDNIYLITNVMPAGQMKTPRTVYVQRANVGNLINFTTPDDGPRVTGFNVYRSTSPRSGFTKLNSSPLARQPSTSYTDLTAVKGTTYYYGVTTVGTSGQESDKYIVST